MCICDRCGSFLFKSKTDTPNPEWGGSWGCLCDKCVQDVFGDNVPSLATRFEVKGKSWVRASKQWKKQA